LGRNRLGVGQHRLVEGGVLVPHGEVLPDEDPGAQQTEADQGECTRLQAEGKPLQPEAEALGLGDVALGVLHTQLGLR
jgi:hypothetical protein